MISNEGSHAYVRKIRKKNVFRPPFWPLFGPNRSKCPKIIFFLILMLNHFHRGVICLCLNKTSKNGTFGLKTGYRAQKKPKNDFFSKKEKMSRGNIPTFRKTQENNFQDHPGT